MGDGLGVALECPENLGRLEVEDLNGLVGSAGDDDVAIRGEVEGRNTCRFGRVEGRDVVDLGVGLDGFGVDVAGCGLALLSYRREARGISYLLMPRCGNSLGKVFPTHTWFVSIIFASTSAGRPPAGAISTSSAGAWAAGAGANPIVFWIDARALHVCVSSILPTWQSSARPKLAGGELMAPND
jgi:hypothetical protein